MKTAKIFTTIFLSILLIFNFSITYSAETMDNISFEVEVSSEELQKGVDLIAYYTNNGDINIVKADEIASSISASSIEATFSVYLTKVGSSQAILSWTAVASQLKNVSGSIYCKNTSALSPKTYCSSFIHCPYLDGTEGRASEATSSFTVPFAKTTYKVGYTGVNLRTITRNYYFGSGYSVVTK